MSNRFYQYFGVGSRSAGAVRHWNVALRLCFDEQMGQNTLFDQNFFIWIVRTNDFIVKLPPNEGETPQTGGFIHFREIPGESKQEKHDLDRPVLFKTGWTWSFWELSGKLWPSKDFSVNFNLDFYSRSTTLFRHISSFSTKIICLKFKKTSY